MKIITFFKAILTPLGLVIPQATAGRIISQLIIWGAESLVKNTKTSHDDEALAIIKGAIEGGKVKKN